MTAKDFVKSHYPNMKSERHKEEVVLKDVYYLIRDGNSFMYFSEGGTESKAWIAAKEKIIEELNKKDTER
jgi:hypothetical protein